MKQQIQIYSLETKAFYTEKERVMHNNISWAKGEKILLEEYLLFTSYVYVAEEKLHFKFKNFDQYKKQKKNNKYFKTYSDNFINDNKSLKKSKEYKNLIESNSLYKILKAYIKMFETLLRIEIKHKISNKMKYKKLYPFVRKLNPNSLKRYNKISIFESSFTRTLEFKTNETTTDIFIVKVTDKMFYPIMEQLINNSFSYRGEKYLALTATAGQIRLKKVIFIKESIFIKNEKKFMCGLTIKDINNSELKGCNVNKFLSYLGLIFSDSDEWVDFDINKAIVIDDFETIVNGEVDFIEKKLVSKTKKVKNRKTGEAEDVIEEYWELADKPVRGKKDVTITHSDGCGWILPSKSKVNFQFRAPWMKGLLTPANFISYCRHFNNENYEIVDIYGKTWNLKEDGILYVFSKSQFKMWKYYPNTLNEDGTIKYGWDTYKENFIKYGCRASKCHEETGKYKTGRFNYQMMQTLTDVSDDELDELIKPTKDLITNAYTNKDVMLEILGAGSNNPKKNNLQRALEIYPELLNDYHVKKELGESISAKRNDAKFARIKIDAKSVFILPDVYAWLQYTFGDKTVVPEGLLKDGEVYCRLYKNSPKLLCNRSPALFREHAVRKNVAHDRKFEWFCTDGLYASTHDLISKILQYDNDGDTSLVIAEKKLIEIAERNMKDVVPLYYKMGTAKPEIITNKSIYESIKTAWRYGNIGSYSNRLTKFWNNYDKDSDLDLAKIVCALNNYSIDCAKTLEMPKAAESINNKVEALKKLDMPYFAQFAKDELEGKVSEINNSTVNRLCAKIEEIKIQDYDFSKVGKFKKAMLMRNSRIVVSQKVVDKYDYLDNLKNSYFRDAKLVSLTKEEIASSVYAEIKKELLESFPEFSIVEIVDMIIKYIYKGKDRRKSFLFNCFGDIIVENLKRNLEGTIQCSKCGCRVKLTGKNQKMCSDCAKEENRKKTKERMTASRKLNKAV